MARKPAAAKRPGDAGPFANWEQLGLPAFAAALAPWQNKLTHTALISDYYQPQINIIASLVGVLVCFCVWRMSGRLKHRALVRQCLGSLIAFIATIAILLLLNTVLDDAWAPNSELADDLVRSVLQFLYVAVFAFFSWTVAVGLRLR